MRVSLCHRDALVSQDVLERIQFAARHHPTRTERMTQIVKVEIGVKRSPDNGLVIDAFRGGAKGVCCRAETWQRLCKCSQSVHQGQVWVNSHQLHCIFDALVSATPLRLVNLQGRRLLTKREDEVVKPVADGLSRPDRAHREQLPLRIYEQLGISSRVELVLYALKRKQG